MVDMKKVDVLSSLLRERSGLDVREAVVRFYIICPAYTVGCEVYGYLC